MSILELKEKVSRLSQKRRRELQLYLERLKHEPPAAKRKTAKTVSAVGKRRVQELKRDALRLPDNERAALAANLLQTLPAVLSDKDEGIAEALRRDVELEANPASGMSWAELKKGLGR